MATRNGLSVCNYEVIRRRKGTKVSYEIIFVEPILKPRYFDVTVFSNHRARIRAFDVQISYISLELEPRSLRVYCDRT